MISLDTETTGLNPERHEVWEVGLVDLKTNAETLVEFSVQNLRDADPGALRINGYLTRAELPAGEPVAMVRTEEGYTGRKVLYGQDGLFEGNDPRDAAHLIARITSNQTLLGCNVAWDAQMLENLLRFYGVRPAWKHRFLELGSYAAGQLNRDQPLSTQTLASQFEFGSPDEAHTALGDARWNVGVYRNLIARRENV